MLERPNLNCAHCKKIYEENEKPPACFLPIGCDVEDVIGDIQLGAIVSAYLSAKMLSNSPVTVPQAQMLLQEVGLTEEPHLLVQFERIYNEVMSQKAANEQAKREGKSRGRNSFRRI